MSRVAVYLSETRIGHMGKELCIQLCESMERRENLPTERVEEAPEEKNRFTEFTTNELLQTIDETTSQMNNLFSREFRQRVRTKLRYEEMEARHAAMMAKLREWNMENDPSDEEDGRNDGASSVEQPKARQTHCGKRKQPESGIGTRKPTKKSNRGSGEKSHKCDASDSWFKASRNRTIRWVALTLRLLHTRKSLIVQEWDDYRIVVKAANFERRMGMAMTLSREFLATIGMKWDACVAKTSESEVLTMLQLALNGVEELLSSNSLSWIEHCECCGLHADRRTAVTWDRTLKRKMLSSGALQPEVEAHGGISAVAMHTALEKRRGNLEDKFRWIRTNADGEWERDGECAEAGCRRMRFVDYATWNSKEGLSIERALMPSVLCGWMYAHRNDEWTKFVEYADDVSGC